MVIEGYFYFTGPIGDGVDDTVAVNFGGGGTQSDNIYGNIDPVKYDWSNQAQDIYSGDHPFIENIVGRITGWDVQDADALVVRSIFYNDILENADLKEWKENYGNIFGGGVDFRKPLWVQTLNHLPIIKEITVLPFTTGNMLVGLKERWPMLWFMRLRKTKSLDYHAWLIRKIIL